MKISEKDWKNYIAKLRKVNDVAAKTVADYMGKVDISTHEGMNALLDYAYAVATKYGEGAAELACQMHEAMAEANNVVIPPAEPAPTATYGEVARAVRGKMFDTKDPEAVGSAVGRLVKMAGVDTTQQNAIRDGAEWAWIPSGDTCAFCLMLSSRGWQKASKDMIKNGHAEHIHANCDCTFAVRFDGKSTVAGYDPDALYDKYNDASDGNSKDKLNALRREYYAENKGRINAQKRAAYANRIEAKKGLDGGGGSSYNDSPAKKKDDIRTLPKQLFYEDNGAVQFIPRNAIIEDPISIAGKGSQNKLRDTPRLIATYNKENPEEWSKMAGKIISDKYAFDIHWYEYEGVMYEHKIKGKKEIKK